MCLRQGTLWYCLALLVCDSVLSGRAFVCGLCLLLLLVCVLLSLCGRLLCFVCLRSLVRCGQHMLCGTRDTDILLAPALILSAYVASWLVGCRGLRPWLGFVPSWRWLFWVGGVGWLRLSSSPTALLDFCLSCHCLWSQSALHQFCCLILFSRLAVHPCVGAAFFDVLWFARSCFRTLCCAAECPVSIPIG